jgi:hypothetical protein
MSYQCTSRSQAVQLEKIVDSLRLSYRRQDPRAAGEDRVDATAYLFGEHLLLNLADAIGVRVVLSGNDGALVTVDGAGRIKVFGPEEPGDTEVSRAVASIVQGIRTLSRSATLRAAA